MTCARCGRGGDTVQRRRLWAVVLYVALCDDCNDYVQGPDHVDIENGNVPTTFREPRDWPSLHLVRPATIRVEISDD